MSGLLVPPRVLPVEEALADAAEAHAAAEKGGVAKILLVPES